MFLSVFTSNMMPGTGVVAIVAVRFVGGAGAGILGMGAIGIKLEQVGGSAVSATRAGAIIRGGELFKLLEEAVAVAAGAGSDFLEKVCNSTQASR